VLAGQVIGLFSPLFNYVENCNIYSTTIFAMKSLLHHSLLRKTFFSVNICSEDFDI
jgi:hypothetical protein